jgi:cysteine desulfurase family protein
MKDDEDVHTHPSSLILHLSSFISHPTFSFSSFILHISSLILRMSRIYLDNAATSWPKPEAVYQAVERYQREIGAPAGRSAYEEATSVGRAVDDARQAVARLLGVVDARRVIFCFNGTDALNLAIHGLLRRGDRAITTVAEHNSVLRPLRAWEQRGEIEVARVGCDREGFIALDEIESALEQGTRLVAVTHASNVTGALQDIEAIGRLAHERGALLLVDAAQSLGHVPIDVSRLPVDLLAASGHKGLLGPLGTGLLYIRPGAEEVLQSIRHGGTGTRSEEDRQPNELPEKYESGNLNAPGIIGLGAGVRWLLERGVEKERQHELQLVRRLCEGLRQIPAVRVFGPDRPDERVGVVSITVSGYDPQELALVLDSAYRVQVRAGLHCAPLMHESLGTLSAGGTVRFSLGAFTTTEEIDAAIRALQEVSR